MPVPVLDAIAVTSSDIPRSLAFYRLLGFEFAEPEAGAQHVEAETAPDAVRLMIDSAGLMEKLTGSVPHPANHASFGLLCESPAEVDRIVEGLVLAGHPVPSPPHDAFWGQRYATVIDPDGYLIDLFAAL